MPRKQRSPRSNALQVILLQTILVVIIAVSLLFLRGRSSGYSFLLGGFTSILPNLMFTYRLFSETSARAVTRIMLRLYVGEAIKLFTIGVLFIVMIRFMAVNLTPYIIGFIVAQIGVMVAPIMFLLRREHY
jgi:ATP synthase protein I